MRMQPKIVIIERWGAEVMYDKGMNEVIQSFMKKDQVSSLTQHCNNEKCEMRKDPTLIFSNW